MSFSFFRKPPVILLLIVGLMVSFEGIIPLEVKRFIYGMSLSIKAVIVFVLPPLIFMLLFKTLSGLSRKATAVVALILGGLCCSNFLSTMISYHIGTFVYQLDLALALPKEGMGLTPLWTFELPKWIANDQALMAGLVLGLGCSLLTPHLGSKIAISFEKMTSVILKVLTTIIPLFVLGFAIKLIHEKTLGTLLRDYSLIFLVVAISAFLYIVFLYALASRFQGRKWGDSLKNMAPAAAVGLSSMSSAAAMPFTLQGVEKNGINSGFAGLSVPLTLSTHLIGDCFAIPIFAFAVMKNFGVAEPEFLHYLVFSLYFVLAKFSVAAIPGGGIIVMLPILESQLGFTGGMSSLITALYILFDPIITSANVMGNGAFSLILGKSKYAQCSLKEKS